MKAGDLVTFSAYAEQLQGLQRWSTRYREYKNKPPLVGLVISVSPSRYAWEGQQYHIRWMERQAPRGRDGQWGQDTFYRKDLKFVSRGR